jgi:hypothetical protein
MVKIEDKPVFMRSLKESYLNENSMMSINLYPDYPNNGFFSQNLSSEEDIEIDISEFRDIESILDSTDSDEEQEEIVEEIQKEQISEIPKFPRSLKRANRFKLVTRRIDNGRIRHKSVKNMEVFTTTVKNVKMTGDGPIRSGAIIYTHFQGKTYFALGQDSVYGDLTDFSGGKKQGESIIEGGLRELEEESLGVFGKVLVSDVKDCMGFYTNNMLVMFIHLDVNMQRIVEEFDKRLGEKSENENLEVNQIVWLEKSDFLNSIEGKGRRLYSRVRRLLSKVTDIIAEI